MASYFGEVLPVWSRATDEDEDDDESILPGLQPADVNPVVIKFNPELNSEIQINGHIQCSHLVIALGPVAKALKRLRITENLTLIGTIISGIQQSESLGQAVSEDHNCSVFRTIGSSQVCLVLSSKYISDSQSYSWCAKLMEHFGKSVNTIILSSSHVSEYKTDVPPSELNTPFITCLKTESWTEKLTVPFLTQPNMITGLAAQMLTYCQISNIPAVIFHLYQESLFMDNIALVGFQKLLKCLPIDCLKSNVDIRVELFPSSEQSLYI